MMKLIFSTFLAFIFFTTIYCEDLIPPPFWCETPSLAKKANVLDQCNAYNTSAYGRKFKLTFLYESLCPDCQLFMKNVLYARIWKDGRDFIDLELIPYGNARHTNTTQNGTYDISCQHGPVECRLNKLHSCVIHQLNDFERWFPFIYCMEAAMSEGQDPDEATKKCYQQMSIKLSEQNKITECTQGPLGDQLQKVAADRTDAIVPDKHEFVPWILIDNISLKNAQFYQAILFDILCSWYRAKDKPAGCQGFSRAMRRNKCLR